MVRGMPTRHALIALVALSASLPAVAQSGSFVNWESPQSHPIDLTPNGQVLLAVNTPDARLEVFDVVGGIPTKRGSVPVGLDPVSVRAHGNSEAWVVNQISDSVSIIDLATMRVRKTILVGDEPADVVFAGSPEKAFVSLSMAEKVAVMDATAPGIVTNVAIAGSSPRALTASPDGTTVYLAIFESGNHTTSLPFATVSRANSPYACAGGVGRTLDHRSRTFCTVCSTVSCDESTTCASEAGTSGATARSISRASRSRISATRSSRLAEIPFSINCLQRRSARACASATKNIFSEASLKTIVPISRPSATKPGGWRNALCLSSNA